MGVAWKELSPLVFQVYELLQRGAGLLFRARKITARKKAIVDSLIHKTSFGMLPFMNLLSFGTLNTTTQADSSFRRRK